MRGLDLDNEEQIDVLYSAPFSALATISDGNCMIEAEVEAVDEASAWSVFNRFMCDELGDVHVVRIDLDLVTITDLAERCDVNRETARLWSTGARRDNFPVPFTTAGSSKVWAWSDIYRWLLSAGKSVSDTYAAEPLSVNFIENHNGLVARRRSVTKGWEGPRWITQRPSHQNVLMFIPPAKRIAMPEQSRSKVKAVIRVERAGA
ncbi:hypothetical protein PTW37_06420 [Arthrobacter agilis]|uniref:hypothetical protein n=1 Tax=Arthrobacter agilis TaxID=37921 RepID=UPI002365C077|nr:hypothetical protein [Arthrobacter agilis]WDF34528.1 hypothetical protein PTW37_06420 [Arthrobacter agilis]